MMVGKHLGRELRIRVDGFRFWRMCRRRLLTTAKATAFDCDDGDDDVDYS